MRILQVIPAIADRYGGPSETVIALARALIDRGEECLIATTDADGAGALPVRHDGIVEWRGAPVRFFPRAASESFKYSRALSRWLRDNVHRFDVVHVHAVFSHASLAAAAACRASGVPFVLRPLGTLDPETMAGKWLRKRLFWHAFGCRMATRAAAVHYATERERRAVESSLGIGRGIVVPTGIDLPAARRTRTPRGGEAGVPYVLVMARLDPIKRIELLIDAFLDALADASLADWRLRVAGDGAPAYVRRLRAAARARPAGARVEFTGWVSGDLKAALIERAGLFALTSRHENFGRSVAEALAAGVPALVTRGVYLCDMIEQADAGWVVDDARADVARALGEAMSDSGKRLAKGERAAGLARAELDLAISVERLLEHYARIARAARPRASARPGLAASTSGELVDVEPPS